MTTAPPATLPADEVKPDVAHAEMESMHGEKVQHTDNETVHGDQALKTLGDERVELTAADNARILRKTDLHILTCLFWVYFLQILDKTAFGTGNVFGLSADTHLVGNQYSLISTMNAIAQVAWMPFSSWLIVRVNSRYLMCALCLGWGIAQTCMAASKNFGGLVATRFLLGLFETGCLPLFSILTAQWYRRSEQPLRVAVWYSTNGLATIVANLLAFGLGHVNNPNLHGWQAIYLVVGLLTVITVPPVFYLIDSDVPHARFLTPHEKLQAIERLRANQTGTGSNEFKWGQAFEVLLDPKSYLFIAQSLLLNVGAGVTNAFGPTLIANFGFDKYTSALLGMPFGFLQFILILIASYCTQRFSQKGLMLLLFMLPVVAGCGLLYGEANSAVYRQGPALAGYYLLSFLFAGNPLIVSWMVANTAGQTKKSVTMSLYAGASAAGNIIGPLLFKSSDKARHYKPGVRSVMAIFIALEAVIALTILLLVFMNKRNERRRVKAGKPQHLKDTSMAAKYEALDHSLGNNALLDITDVKNDEFIYIY